MITSVGILFVSWVCAVDFCTTSVGEHFESRKLYYSSFAWFPFGVGVGCNMNRGLVACQNFENRVFIDGIVPEKNQVEVTAHLGKLTVH